jgi:hypothetical protein
MVNFEWIVEGSNSRENQTRIRRHVMRNYAQKKKEPSSMAVPTSEHIPVSRPASHPTGQDRQPAKRARMRRRLKPRRPESQIDTLSPAKDANSTESTVDSQLASDTTRGQLPTSPAVTSVIKYMKDPFASTPVKVQAANYTIFQDFVNMPRYNKTVREHYDFIHENKFRFAVEDPLMFLTVSLEVMWQRCARKSVASTPGLKYVQLQSERFLGSRLGFALAGITATRPQDQLERRSVAEITVLQPLMHLIFLHKRYGDRHLSDNYQGVFDTLLTQMRQRLPDNLRLEECTLFGSIVSCEPLHMPKVLGPEEARRARQELQELFSCMESAEERMRVMRVGDHGDPSVLGMGFLRPGSLVRRILAESPVLASWQTLSYSYLNCRFAALVMLLDATYCEVGSQFLERLNRKLSDLKVEADSGSIFTLLIVLMADSEFRDSQRNYRVARILRSACKHLAEDIIRMLSEGILISLIGGPSSAVGFDIVQSLELESLRPPLLQTPGSEAGSPGEAPLALFSENDMGDPSFGSPVTPSLLNASTASRTQRLRGYIAYFASHVWYQHPKVDCASDFLANWGPMISHGEALLYSIAGAAAAHIALTESATVTLSSHDAVAFKTRAMELIRRTVEADETRSIMTISAIAFLAGSEAFDCGNIAAASSHLQGISQLIELRGGIQTLGWQIMEIIYNVDLQVASMTLAKPRFPFVENPEIAPAVRSKARNAAGTQFSLPENVARLFRRDFVELFEQVRDLALFRHVAPTELRTPMENLLSSHPQNIGFLFSYQKLYVGHCLLSHLALHQPVLAQETRQRGKVMARDAQVFEKYLPSTDIGARSAGLSNRQYSAGSLTGISNDTPLHTPPNRYKDTIAKCVQTAMLLFVYMTTSRVGSSTSSALIKTLSANLQNALLDAASQPSWQEPDVYYLYIWTFFIGALATEKQPLWPWFVDGMTQRLMDFQNVSQVREMLGRFLYVHDLFDSSLTMMRAESTLGYMGG